MDIEGFRDHFPEFADETAYPDAMIEFWSGLAEARMSPAQARWGNLYPYGLELMTAHYLSGAKQDEETSPGSSGGMVSSESAGDVSISYDTGAVAIEGAGDWNATSYGRKWKQLANIVGMGGIQLYGGMAE